MAELLTKYTSKTPKALTKAKQNAFLEHYERTMNVSEACRLAEISHATPYSWVVDSDNFAKKFDDLRNKLEKAILARYESKIDGESLDKEFDKTTALLSMFRMKRLDPRYRDSQQVNIGIAGPSACIFEVSNPVDKASKSRIATQPVEIIEETS